MKKILFIFIVVAMTGTVAFASSFATVNDLHAIFGLDLHKDHVYQEIETEFANNRAKQEYVDDIGLYERVEKELERLKKEEKIFWFGKTITNNSKQPLIALSYKKDCPEGKGASTTLPK